MTVQTASTRELLLQARQKLYSIAGGSYDSDDVTAARLTTAQRTEYFRSPEFRNWVAAEKAAGNEVFWLRDVDKTQAAGDIFTFFYKWRCDNNKFTPEGLAEIKSFLRKVRRKNAVLREAVGMSPVDALNLWLRKEEGLEGVSLLDFWSGAYWPSQKGLTRVEKIRQVNEFAPTYADRIYPGVPEENRVLEESGVHVVIVSNGDQELAVAAAPYMGIKPENVVGSNLLYADSGRSEGEVHSYEVFGEEWGRRPQPGKHLNFHFWVHTNRHRWGWSHITDEKIVIAGRDGDSASADGGMMIMLPPPAIGNFMIDTPGEPQRLQAFFSVAAKYGWTRGQFFTLTQQVSKLGFKP